MDKKKQLDKIRGSLIGGAVGDALGYPVEFIYSYKDIKQRLGEHGITRLDTTQWWLPDGGQSQKAWVSDDTQMTLFTACGLLNAKAQGMAPKYAICYAYIEWYFTQIGCRSSRRRDCWIGDVPELNYRRAPGNTCMTALKDVLEGKETPIEKVEQFKSTLGDFPVIVGAGVTSDNVAETIRKCDGLIIGNWFKCNHDAYNMVNEKYVKELMEVIGK